MTDLLIVAATEAEVKELAKHTEYPENTPILITGVGMVNAVFSLMRYLQGHDIPKSIVNVGIAGSFNDNIGIGKVVQVVHDRFSEFGAEDHDKFLKADDMGLLHKNEIEFSTDERVDGLMEVAGLTVNTVHGSENSISRAISLFAPDVETMEGAACAFVAAKFSIPWVQIRAISNKVEPRNRDEWNIPLAIDNLAESVVSVLRKL